MSFFLEFSIDRPEEFGGNVKFNTFEALEQAFAKEVCLFDYTNLYDL